MMKHLDLFSGIGGFALGLQRTGGFKTIGFCDFDAKTHPVLKKNFPGVPIYDDVRTLKGADIGTVDIVTGGFPCQDLSVAGKGAGLKGERSGLWYEMHRIIKETRPKWVIAENVAVLRSRGLDEVLGSLAEIGYDAEWHCIPACSVGAPHRRDRIWIVAYPNGSVATNGGQRQDSQGEGNSRGTEQGRSGGDSREGCVRSSGNSTEDAMAHTNNRGSLVRRYGELPDAEKTTILWRNIRRGKEELVTRQWREGEPRPYGVADGVPNRVDRLKQLGNALVPQIVTIIGSAILEAEQT